MAVTTRAVRAQASASNTTQDFTVSGFGTPTAIYVYVSNGTTDDNDATHYLVGHGFADPNAGTPRQYCCSMYSPNGETTHANTSRMGRAQRDDAVVYVYDRLNSGAIRKGVVSAFTTVSDGVQITWSGDTSYQPYVTVVLIKGCAAVAGYVDTNATQDADATATTTGITPDFVLCAHINHATLPVSTNNGPIGIGVAWNDGGASPYPNYGLFHTEDSSAATTSVIANLRNDYCSAGQSGTAAAHEVTAWASGSFTLTTRLGTGTRKVLFLALETGGGVESFISTTPTGSSAFAPTTSTFEPDSVLMWTTAITTANSSQSSGNACSGNGLWYIDQATTPQALGHYSTIDDGVAEPNPTVTTGRVSAKCIIQGEGGGTPLFDATPGTSNANITWTSTGFSIADANVTQGASAYYVFGVAFSGTSAVEYLRLLTHPSAASAGSVEGWVVGDDNTTYYGYFSGKSFEAALDGGQAELLVPTADISPDGATLTTSDTPQVVVRNSSFGTTMCDATVIEE